MNIKAAVVHDCLSFALLLMVVVWPNEAKIGNSALGCGYGGGNY